ncbi:MAG: peptidoglycan-binding domain-containing protein [Betaproteobacteria bacterium]
MTVTSRLAFVPLAGRIEMIQCPTLIVPTQIAGTLAEEHVPPPLGLGLASRNSYTKNALCPMGQAWRCTYPKFWELFPATEDPLMKTTLKWKYAVLAIATSLALGVSAAHAEGDTNTATATGKQNATAIGAGTGAVAGAVVGGPVGALVGAGVGAYVGHEGTDANGHVPTSRNADGTVRKAQAALNIKGYSVAVDGRFGPNTQSAVRNFQEQNGLAASGTLDSATLNALGVRS